MQLDNFSATLLLSSRQLGCFPALHTLAQGVSETIKAHPPYQVRFDHFLKYSPHRVLIRLFLVYFFLTRLMWLAFWKRASIKVSGKKGIV